MCPGPTFQEPNTEFWEFVAILTCLSDLYEMEPKAVVCLYS